MIFLDLKKNWHLVVLGTRKKSLEKGWKFSKCTDPESEQENVERLADQKWYRIFLKTGKRLRTSVSRSSRLAGDPRFADILLICDRRVFSARPA